MVETLFTSAYLSRLTEFLGANVIQAFSNYNRMELHELFRLLSEDMKYMTSEMEQSLAVALRIPTKLVNVFRTFNPSAPKHGSIIPNEKYQGRVEIDDNKITLETKLILPVFQFVISGVVNVFDAALQNEKLQGITDVFMTGGFSDFPLLQDALESNFPNLNFYFIENPRDILMLGGLAMAQNAEFKDSLQGNFYCLVLLQRKSSL